nr:T9SS type A sorting domain-containing protein [Saprospiraceae bacterium]
STDSNPTPVISGNSGGTFTSDSGDIEINSTTGQINLENSLSGTYLITYNDETEEGCEESIEVVIVDGPTATVEDNGPLCEGENLELTAEGGVTYSWSGPDGFTSDEQNPVIDEVSLAGEGNYTVMVTDDNGCTVEETTEVVIFENPQVTASNDGPYCEGLAIELSADGGTDYQWTGPDGFTSNEQNPTLADASAAQAGDYTVVVTDDNGCVSEGSTAVTVNESPQATASNSGPYCEGESIELSAGGGTSYSWTGPDGFTSNEQDVLIPDSSPAKSGDYTVEVTDDNGCTAEATTNVVVNENPQATASNVGPFCMGRTITLSASGGVDYEWSGPDGFSSSDQNPGIENAGLANEGEYTVAVTDANGCTDSATTSVTVIECITISGSVAREGDEAAINNVDVNLSGDVSADRITNIDGNFSFELTDGTNFTLTPTKEDDTFNGVEIGDALIIQQHLNGINIIDNPFKLIAADVNQDEVVDEMDILTKFSAIIRDPTVDADFPNSWRFLPENYIFPDPTSPWGFPQSIDLQDVVEDMDHQNFTGVKIGDLNSSADPSQSSPGIPNRDENDDLGWKVIDQSWMEADQIIDVIFTAGYFQGFAAYQFGVSFDDTQLEYVDAFPGTALPLPPENFGAFDAAEGNLRMLWLSDDGLDTSLDEDTEVFTLRFRSLTAEGTISDYLNRDEGVLAGIAYNADLLASGIQIEFVEEDTVFTTDLGRGNGLDLLQNKPNPFNYFTTIEFVLPQSGEATLRIMDISGREVFKLDGMYPGGHNEVRIDWQSTPGVYFYELITPYGTRVRKMIAQ